MISVALISSCLSLGADTGLISAIMTQESAGQIEALNINQWDGKPVRPDSVSESVEVAAYFVDKGYTVDIGLMGINSVNVERLGHTLQSAYEPCLNIGLGEKILMENIQTAQSAGYSGDKALQVALSLYNTGSLTFGFENGYVDKVWTLYVEEKSEQARYSSLDVPWNAAADWSDHINHDTPQWSLANE